MAGAGYKFFQTGEVLEASEVNNYLMQQTVMVFADSAARTTALSGVLAEGMISYLQDTNKVEFYDGSAWTGYAQLATANTFTTGTQTINAGGTGNTVALIVKGQTGQTAKIQEWQNVSGTVVSDMTHTGRFGISIISNVANTGTYMDTGSNTIRFEQRAAATVGIIIKGAASQTANLQEWQNSAGTVLSWIASDGTPVTATSTGLKVGGTGITGHFTVRTPSASTIAAVIRAAASQTANLQEWQDSAGTVLNRVSSDGRLIVGATDTAGSISINPDGASRIGLRIRLAGSATAEAIRIDNSSGANLTSITAAGTINFVTGNTATTATAGAITPPSQVVGYITMQIAGTTVKVPYYAN